MQDGDADAVNPDVPPPQRYWRPEDAISRVYVSFKGLKRLSPHTIIGECSALRYARTLQQAQLALQDATARLEELAVFKSLRADVSIAPTGIVDIAYVVEERKRQFTVSGNVDKRGEVTCDVRAEQPALGGRLVSGSISASASVSQAHEFSARLSTPRFLQHRLTSSLEAARTCADETPASSYSEQVDHVTWAVTTPGGAHCFTAEAAVRSLCPAVGQLRLPSSEVQQARLASVKTSVRYSFETAWRHADLLAPWAQPRGRGCVMRGTVEAAGLLGDVGFLRGELRAVSAWQLPWGVECDTSLACGALLPTDGRSSCVQDRFFLGGASGSSTVVKGFAHRGIGPVGICAQRRQADPTEAADTSIRPNLGGTPQRATDALGGDAMLSAFVVVSAPLPVDGAAAGALAGPAGSARVFSFMGVGGLVAGSGGSCHSLVRGLRPSMRASAGVGVAVSLGVGTLELTLAQPMWALGHDEKQRWQVGVRLESP